MSLPRLQLRSDLITQQISLGNRSVWVLKDPLSHAFHFFSDSEFGILRSIRSGRSFEEIESKYRGLVAPVHLAQFLSAASRMGLVETKDGVPTSRVWKPRLPSRRHPWWTQPLAIRLPGITPDRWRVGRMIERWIGRADASEKPPPRVTPTSQWGKLFLSAILGLAFCALLIVGMRMDEFLADSAGASSRLVQSLAKRGGLADGFAPGGILLLFAAALIITKVIHELAHAVACTALGGRCREIGVMLLLGIPCLYCDVSDVWLMPRRRDRILVSAAGILAEWTVAALATFVWATTQPGTLHDLSALIMMVASISTLIINANPLLRYDGYYILSDLVGIPNLSSESREALRAAISRRTPQTSSPIGSTTQGFLVAYAVCSTAYRLFVFTLIFWTLFTLTESRFGIGIALPLIAWLSFAILGNRMKRPTQQQTQASGETTKSVRHRLTVLATGLGLALFVPLPQSVRVGGIVRATEERPIFATTTGRLMTTDEGDRFEIDDWRLRLQHGSAKGSVAEIRAELAAARIDRLDRPTRALVQPILEEKLAAAQEQRDTIARRLEEANLPDESELSRFDPPPRRITRRERVEQRWDWTGQPLRIHNVGATIESGTLLGYLGHPSDRVISLYVDQESIDQVRVGQTVAFGYRGMPAGTLRGTIESISADPVDDIPEELISAGWGSRPSAVGPGSDREPVMYEVTASILSREKTSHPLPPRLMIPARIHLPAKSLVSRWQRWWSDNF
ncbi:HlyD family efflux transporter periplasmic adaptor subunit [Rhodopirellula sallentina]|uniref:Peptidase, M50 family n=1 Tax=Rhodopirellula sallentina SM41 TaxID=1263870 RepID=M5U4S8_9BACT|nr:HlyD family efflux transporter periplasmic adaptor subunit [Rhodopirellula sallentina]EMI56259.1 peptidase, M50 family [Rhodopirellula sallentina SM41]